MSEKTYLLLLSVVLLSAGVVWKMRGPAGAKSPAPVPLSFLSPPSLLAKWPLARASIQKTWPGVTYSRASDPDGTDVDLLEFDFKTNPKLRLELFDQQKYQRGFFKMDALSILRGQSDMRGQVVAVCNGGPFNDDTSRYGSLGYVAPVVELKNVHLVAETKPLWTFGVKQAATQSFDSIWHSTPAQLKQLDYATGGLQCLVKDGVPLKIAEPLTRGHLDQLKESSNGDVGNLGRADWTKTSRVSLAWNRTCSKLWMLCVREPESEAASRAALGVRFAQNNIRSPSAISGGWSLQDVQSFWSSLGTWGAVLLASGDFVQFAQRSQGGQMSFQPSYIYETNWQQLEGNVTPGRGRIYPLPMNIPTSLSKDSKGHSRLILSPHGHTGIFRGGALFYWMVRETR